MAFGRGESRSPSRSTTASTIPVLGDPTYDGRSRDTQRQRQGPAPTSYPTDTDSEVAQHNRLPTTAYQQNENYDPTEMHFSGDPSHGGSYYRQVSGSTNAPSMHQDEQGRFRPLYPTGFNPEDQDVPSQSSPASSRGTKNVLQKPHRQFPDGGIGGQGGKAKRVMDFFRVRGRARTEA
jgi:protein-serine/threonine kinase